MGKYDIRKDRLFRWDQLELISLISQLDDNTVRNFTDVFRAYLAGDEEIVRIWEKAGTDPKAAAEELRPFLMSRRADSAN